MNDSNESVYPGHARFRRTDGPEMGHGEMQRREVNSLDAAGALGGQQSVAMSRFNSRYGRMFPQG